MDAVSHMLAAQSVTPHDQAELDEDLAAWGVEQKPEPQPEWFEVWDEHREALMWWCQGGSQLKFLSTPQGLRCQGLDILALEADARLSGRTVHPDDYDRIKQIARQVTDHLNANR